MLKIAITAGALLLMTSCMSNSKNASDVQAARSSNDHLLSCSSVDETGDKYQFFMDRRGFDEQPGIPVIVVIKIGRGSPSETTGRAQLSEDKISATFDAGTLDVSRIDSSSSFNGLLKFRGVSRHVVCTGTAAQASE